MFDFFQKMYARPTASVTRRLERNASSILIGGLVLSLCVICFLTICKLPCEQEQIHRKYMQDKNAFHEGHEPKKRDYSELVAREKKSTTKSVTADLIVLIFTGPKNYDRRDVIRETWGSVVPENVIKYFVIGTKDMQIEEKATLDYENQVNYDLLLLPDLADSYYALTDKVLESFKWLKNNADYKFILKVDDDTYTRLDIIYQDLQNNLPEERLYWGFFDGRARVKRGGQWAEKKWILCDRYTVHAKGGGYVLSKDLVEYIVNNEKYLQKFNSEDVSVGTWLGPLDISRIHDTRFDTEWESRGCSNKYIITHKQEVKDIKDKHNSLQNSGKLCAKEHKNKLSYEYNWHVPPTECCIRNNSKVP